MSPEEEEFHPPCDHAASRLVKTIAGFILYHNFGKQMKHYFQTLDFFLKF